MFSRSVAAAVLLFASSVANGQISTMSYEDVMKLAKEMRAANVYCPNIWEFTKDAEDERGAVFKLTCSTEEKSAPFFVRAIIRPPYGIYSFEKW